MTQTAATAGTNKPEIQRVFQSKAETKAFYDKISHVYETAPARSWPGGHPSPRPGRLRKPGRCGCPVWPKAGMFRPGGDPLQGAERTRNEQEHSRSSSEVVVWKEKPRR